MATTRDRMRENVRNVLLRPGHIAESFTYVSVVEGTKPVMAAKVEHGGGPQDQSHVTLLTRRATFHIEQSIDKGVLQPFEGDTIIDTTGPEPVVWGLAPSTTAKLRAGLWSLEFTTAVATKQGFRQAAGL